jgi:hypothetical protein
MDSKKALWVPFLSVPRSLSSRKLGAGIHPAEGGTAFAGVTAFPTFYEIIKIYKKEFPKMGTFKVETLCFQEIFSHLPFPKVGLCSLVIFVLA